MKKVSIIVPTFRGESQLKRSLQTIIEQTYKNIEIIVIDDNGLNSKSQIESKKIIRELNDKRLIYITHKKNLNGAAARNTGLKIATGDYICFHDDDDLMLEDRIENCVKILEKEKEYDGIFTGVVCCDENLIPTKIIKVLKKGNCYKDILLDDMFFGTGSNIFITSKAFKRVGFFDERFKRHQDLEYMLRFYDEFETTFLKKVEIIKSKNGINNIPNYEKLVINEELYQQKFEKKINSLTPGDKQKFIDNTNQLLIISKILSEKFSFYNLKNYIKLNFKQKVVIIVKKTGVDKSKIFKTINSYDKKLKYSKMKNFPLYLKNFINEKGGKV